MKVTEVSLAASKELAGRPPHVRTYWQTVLARLTRDNVTLVVGAILFTLFVIAIFAPQFSPYDPYIGKIVLRLKPIGTPGHWLGTDEIGRDIWTRLAYGGRLSLLSGLVPVVLATAAGGFLGIVAGYVGGRVNSLIMRLMDVFYAFPSLLLALAIGGALGPGVENTIIALTVVFVPSITRVVESLTAQVRGLDFVDAARASGAGPLTIIRAHVLTNVLGPVLVFATSLIGISIILASGLSFLGLGAIPPQAEWGLMLNSLRQALYVNPWVAALPGVFIFVTSMCFNLLSDGLRSAMDVRL